MIISTPQLIYSLFVCLCSMIFAGPGLVLSMPVIIGLRMLGEKERKKALKSSTVKILGKDVVSSYKIMSALVVIPSVWVL